MPDIPTPAPGILVTFRGNPCCAPPLEKQAPSGKNVLPNGAWPKSFQVFKPGISISIALSAMLGCLIHHPRPDGIFYLTGIFTFVLCAGSGALNNCQDRHRDTAFERTKNRPLPRGILSVVLVRILATGLIVLGLSGLGMTRHPFMTMAWSLSGVILYNGIYTPLKSKTILAIIPGALCGMVPPALGWAAAGGTLPLPPGLFCVMVIFGVWQLPHYWLILLSHKRDYRKVGLPTMFSLFSLTQMERILVVWVTLYAAMILMLPLFFPDISGPVMAVLGINTLGLFGWFIHHFFSCKKKKYRTAFILLNLSMGTFMIALMVDLLKIIN